MTIAVFSNHGAYAVSVDSVPVATFARLFEARRAALIRAFEARSKGIDVRVTGVIG